MFKGAPGRFAGEAPTVEGDSHKSLIICHDIFLVSQTQATEIASLRLVAGLREDRVA